MSGKPIIYFDLDNTLVDTNRLVRLIGHGLETIGLPLEIYESTLEEYYNSLNGNWTDFHHQELIKLLATNSAQSIESISAEFLNPVHFKTAVFPETVKTLEHFADSHTLRIFSQANLEWQRLKLSFGEISDYFETEHNLISPDKLDASILDQIASKSALVDDKWEVVATLRAQRPDIHIFWINRKNAQPEDASTLDGIAEITTLDEMISELNK